MDILFTNIKLPSIHSEPVPRSRSKVSTYSYAEKNTGSNLNSLPNNKILHWSKLKAFADNILSPAQMMKFVIDGFGNSIVIKGENACCQHFLLYPTGFSKVINS